MLDDEEFSAILKSLYNTNQGMNNPELYAKNNELTRAATDFIMNKYGKWLTWKDSENIMEVGIGDGNNTRDAVLRHIPSNFIEYNAVDISKEFLDVAEGTLLPDSRFKFVQMDIGTKNVPKDFEGKFDHILSYFLMHWVRKPRTAFENMYNMLGPDGEMFAMFFDKVPTDYAFDELVKNPRWAKYGHENFISSHFYSADPIKEYEEDIIAAGIDNFKIQLQAMEFQYPSTNNSDGLLHSVNPVLKNIPKDEIDDYKRDFLEGVYKNGRYSEENVSGNTIKRLKYNLIVVYAKKEY